MPQRSVDAARDPAATSTQHATSSDEDDSDDDREFVLAIEGERERIDTGYFSPEAFANALSGMTNLRTLLLHFLSLPPRRNYLTLPPLSGERIILPALTFLKYRGTSKYLDSLVARIDAPGLGDIDITFFSQPTMDASQLGRFVERTGIQTSLSRADVQISADAISIFFFNSSTPTPLRLQISCKQLDWQLSSMAQVCDQFSPFLFRVNNPRINTTQSSSEQDATDSEQWLELIRAFRGATGLPVASELTTVILCALGLAEEGHVTVLPSLRHLHIENLMAMNEPSWDCLLSFITLRSRSGHPVQGTSTPTVLVPELLSFSPHFLLDDTINIANDGVGRAVDAMEDFLNLWAETRLEREPDWDDDKELEQGLVSFQTVTLLEFHTDIAFDFFEAWSLRNIFAVPADLPLKEAELLAEIDELWREIEKVRSMRRVSALPPLDPANTQSLLPEPEKREWELGRAGYISWVNAQLLRHANTATGSTLESDSVEEMPGAKHVSAALCALEHDDS
ncbi:hypothetical protein EDB83DRAFT_2527159 [Lactarius deliciosus]|nr:hypothetical protein EDB83DRAFT_2527159 [Lactarius deliciosus]